MLVKLKHGIKDWIKAMLIALFGLWFLVSFIGNWFVVSSGSMEGSLFAGDLVYVNKLAYGARFPLSAFGFNFSYHRLPGYVEVNRNEVVAFNYPDLDTLVPIDKKSVWIKRILGLPGDTVQFKRSVAKVNGAEEQVLESYKFNHHLKVKGDEAVFFYNHDLGDPSRISAQNDWMAALTAEQASQLEKDSQVAFLKPEFNKAGVHAEDAFPFELELGWNTDFYGPVIVPKEGLTVRLTSDNISLYRLCIEVYEEQSLLELGGKFYINGQEISTYTFKQNYYFVAGDNRHNSMDSRHWGFLPESHVIGRVGVVMFSFDRNRSGLFNCIRWNRIFKSI